MSFSALLELGRTRRFSVVLFYHFAFLAISIALLGLGAGAVFAFLRREWLEGWSIGELGTALCAANALIILGALEGDPGEHEAVEWAWAMNAASSVLGSVLAMMVAIQFGLNVTLMCGAAAYLLALLLLPTFGKAASAAS
jgi:hypothetical protein